jgi:signal transduction histidine kinase
MAGRAGYGEHGSVVHDPVGAARWVDGVILDISERRQMEQDCAWPRKKAELAAAARASFVANMSHEIRTPMNAILGLRTCCSTPLTPEQRRHLDTVRQSGRSLLRLLNEVLDTAKLDRGAVAGAARLQPARAARRAVLHVCGIPARAKGLLHGRAYDPQLPAVLHGDAAHAAGPGQPARQRHQVHGRRRRQPGGPPDDGQLHLLVQDTGIGIPAERATPSSIRSCRPTPRPRGALAARAWAPPSAGSW